MKIIFKGTLFLALVVTSCKKPSVDNLSNTTAVTAEVLTINLISNERYTYTLPSGTENASIETAAQNASLSRLSLVPGIDSLNTYEYVPATGFTGTDVVTLAVTAQNANGCHQHGAGGHSGRGKCGKGKGHHPKGHGEHGEDEHGEDEDEETEHEEGGTRHCGHSEHLSNPGKRITLMFNVLSSN